MSMCGDPQDSMPLPPTSVDINTDVDCNTRPPTFFTKVGKKLCSPTFHQYNNILRLPRPFRGP